MVARGTTDGKGSFTFKGLAPGRYILVINGSELAAAMGKRMPPETERKESHSSVGLGIGGAIFGNGGNGGNGSGRASSGREGASPVKGGSSHHSFSGGGMGVGISIPVGDDPGKEELENKKKDYDWDEAVGDLKIDISWGRGDGPGGRSGRNLGGASLLRQGQQSRPAHWIHRPQRRRSRRDLRQSWPSFLLAVRSSTSAHSNQGGGRAGRRLPHPFCARCLSA